MHKFTLEKSRYFTIVAWTLVIGFAIFVGSLTVSIHGSINSLNDVAEGTKAVLDPMNNY